MESYHLSEVHASLSYHQLLLFRWKYESIGAHHCWPTADLPVAYSAFTDIFLAVVPAVVFSKLQLKTDTKIGLCLLMGTTAFAAICAIVKTSKLDELADLSDFTYGTVDLVIWAIVEANVIIIAACIPHLKPFVISVQRRGQGSERRSLFHRLRGFRSSGFNRTTRDGSDYSSRYQKNIHSTDGVSAGDYPLVTAAKKDEITKDGVKRPVASVAPRYPGIQQTTVIEAEWETV